MADDNTNNKAAAKNAAKAAADLKKQKKKKWCPIVAPEIFQSKVIGEVLLEDASMLMNRTVKVNMMQLSGDMKKQNVNVMFKIIDIKEGKGLTKAVKFEISPFSLRRLAKREKDKLSDSFVVKTLDGLLVRIKPLMVTNNLTKGSVKANLIKSCRAVCKEFVNKMNFDRIIADLVQYKFQKEVRDALHRVYPLKNFEIRVFEIETKKKKETVEEEMLRKLQKENEEKEAEKAEEREENKSDSEGSDKDSGTEQEEYSDQSEDSGSNESESESSTEESSEE